ncbi:MAG: HAMP domain-containing histidine kinase [Prevotella sp.]|jgi:signal transduction histidine kinase|nr:HAMP domain-containing histidine kinase [Prevotella sp.]MCI1281382.1 HAMP domain-containing histidine kinase [Prevotella sp.]
MKLKIKHIAVIVILLLIGIFAYQAYWLVNLYHTEQTKMQRDIKEVIRLSDYDEMMHRFKILRAKKNGQHGTIDISYSANYHANTNKEKDKSTAKVSVQKEKQRRIQEEIAKKHSATVHYSENKEEGDISVDSSGEEKKNDSFDMLGNTKGMQEFALVIQRGIHSCVDAFSKPDINYFDKLLTARFDSLGIHEPHQLLYLHRSQTKKSVVRIDTLAKHGKPIQGKTECYDYDIDLLTHSCYRVLLKPTTLAIIRQMSGILATSFVMILVLCFVFWYLIHTLMKLKTLDEMKTDFTNNITHELKTPISVAYAVNDALLNFDVSKDQKKAREYLLISQEQLKRLSGLVEQILSMSMERRKSLKLTIEEVNVKSMMDALMAEYKLSSDKPIDFSIDVPDDLILNVDRAHFSNIISNLIDNAIKYSVERAEVKISARKGKQVEILISDHGIGIASDKLKYIFDKFYRVPHGNLHEAKGYGLGLYYVKSMMERLNGSVIVESELGKGSTFKLIFNGQD